MVRHEYRVFLGISGKSYTLTIENSGEYFVMPAKTVRTNNTHEITLIALLELINEVTKTIKEECTIHFYCDDFDTYYEWNNEYCKNKSISKTKYKAIWDQIIKQIKSNKYSLNISNNSYLKVIGKVNK